jgi:hypothetical protein
MHYIFLVVILNIIKWIFGGLERQFFFESLFYAAVVELILQTFHYFT